MNWILLIVSSKVDEYTNCSLYFVHLLFFSIFSSFQCVSLWKYFNFCTLLKQNTKKSQTTEILGIFLPWKPVLLNFFNCSLNQLSWLFSPTTWNFLKLFSKMLSLFQLVKFSKYRFSQNFLTAWYSWNSLKLLVRNLTQLRTFDTS